MRLAFWNCGVAPIRGQGRRSLSEAVRVLDAALDNGVDLVGLCEVDEAAVSKMADELDRHGVNVIPLTSELGRSRWDLAVLCRQSLSCIPSQPALGSQFGETIKAAHSVRVGSGDDEFRLYLLHWRSRLRGDADHRSSAATTLHNSICEDLHLGTAVVVLGDFNDEPHDRSLSILHASRDPQRVLRQPDTYLYNPCWHLACPPMADPWCTYGSFGRRGKTATRYLLDQALTSAHYLDESSGLLPKASIRKYLNSDPGGLEVDHQPLELFLPCKTTTPSTKP